MTILGFCSSSAAPSEIQRMRAATSLTNKSASSDQTDHEKFFFAAPNSAREADWAVALSGAPRYNGNPVDAKHILALARDHGPQFIECLKGTFAIVIHDAAASKALLAVDRMGIERMTYCISSLGLWFGSRATSVCTICDLPTPVRDQGWVNDNFGVL